MITKRFGCLSGSGLLITIVLLLSLGSISLIRGGAFFSPGALNAQTGKRILGGIRSHAETGKRCAACHVAPWDRETMADRCLSCHTELTQDPKNFHAVMIAEGKMTGCHGCHLDHRGADAPLTATVLGDFPHDTATFSLQAHQKMPDGSGFTCSNCHVNGLGSFDQVTCETCHLDQAEMGTRSQSFTQLHVATFGKDCLACHDGLDSYGHAFDHNQQTFPLHGKHASLECGDCHQGAQSLEDLKSTVTECFDCHAQDNIHTSRIEQDCGKCHTPDGWAGATFDHSLAEFPLLGKHSAVACQDCHTNAVFKGIPQDCYSCHAQDDPHIGQLGQDCAKCHTPEDWKQVTFDHSRAIFTLVGKHTTVACQDCHTTPLFKDTPQDCYSCHAKDDQHNGQFGQDCSLCHTPEGWKPATFDHAKSAFPLTGAHLEIDCTQCHVNNVFKGTPKECVACHGDPAFHRGLFGTNCSACHATSGWSPARFNGPHSFPMNHGGGGTCRTCHPSTLAGYTCYGCHAHTPAEIQSKHREEGIKNFENCLRCHPTGRKGD